MGLFDLFTRHPTPNEGLERYRNTPGVILSDMRTLEEYWDDHLSGAKDLPLDRLNVTAKPVGGPPFTYCRNRARNTQAKTRLARVGYSITNLGGLLGYRGLLEV